MVEPDRGGIVSVEGIYRDPCWSAECGCGWVKSIPLTRTEMPERAIMAAARRHERSASKYHGPHTNRVALRWHNEHPDAVTTVFKAVRVRCRFCDFTSDPCETMSDVQVCIEEHIGTRLHRDAVENRELATALLRSLK
jgi:hypothetical protein